MNRPLCSSTKGSGKLSLRTGTNDGSAAADTASAANPAASPTRFRKARNATSASICCVGQSLTDQERFRNVHAAPMVPLVRRSIALVAFAFLGLGSCATPLARAPVQATFTNPVLDADFPDPTVIR